MERKAGYIIINKPKGITSFGVVNQIKRLSGLKAGHTGTLDPMAEGVLPILLGSATKLSNFIMDGKKEYIASALYGFYTDTLDVIGETIEKKDVFTIPSREELLKVLRVFTGDIEQIPPMYSALKKDGRKLYELAREGKVIEREKRPVTISEIELLDLRDDGFKIRVSCSKGTYIRTLIDDIGKSLGCFATMDSLVRTATGSFKIEESVDLNILDRDNINYYVNDIEKLFFNFPKVFPNNKANKLLLNGVKVKDKEILKDFCNLGYYRVYDEEGIFIGVAKRNKDEISMEYKI